MLSFVRTSLQNRLTMFAATVSSSHAKPSDPRYRQSESGGPDKVVSSPLDHLGCRARLWATVNAPRGAIFRLRLPVGAASLLRNMAPNSSPHAS